MGRLFLHENMFTGELHFEDLPPRMYLLNVSKNQFTGFVDLSCLEEMKILALQITGNPNLEGSIPKRMLPDVYYWRFPVSWIQN
eukprot:CAMPEP_0201503472 /NCGR_PEP_ID=MMETSP0151_2-20130828/84682_1 /ASSEMBLY_ACC=CAM_ASM_000257 /TAXON_ID=200890 /ORGANISM="Paramoeba atlantica, Strain 621/1 / CCAP 1560/9" /LENGTH=83 /DNA_ID=CAMNT_0047897131 /DNA_START=691 /DNA_END=942 /DNA_ORIENTATION=+